jgi:hypothetical protein
MQCVFSDYVCVDREQRQEVLAKRHGQKLSYLLMLLRTVCVTISGTNTKCKILEVWIIEKVILNSELVWPATSGYSIKFVCRYVK